METKIPIEIPNHRADELEIDMNVTGRNSAYTRKRAKKNI
jgi:hypothetical protein